jgi:hypothetical protein
MFSYKNLLILQIIWIFAVILLFSTIPDKKLASIFAGAGFILIPILILISEFQKTEKNKSVIVTVLVFLLISALPIFLLRVFNWSSDFKDLSLLGISADQLHKASNVIYLIMMAVTGAAFLKERKSRK